jgi:hypothetical protein
MFQTLVFIVACLVPSGVFIWAMMTEKARSQDEKRKNRDAFSSKP